MPHVQEALRLLALGFSPIVERPNSKMPLETGWQQLARRSPEAVREAFERAPELAGIGTVTEGFVVVDLDLKPGVNGFESLKALPPLPPTLTSITPSGGRHLFFRTPPGCWIRNSVSKVGPGIDIRGHGGQVVLPPTTINGRAYRWELTGAMADLPGSWLELLTADNPVPTVAAPAAQFAPVRRPAEIQFEAERRARYMATVVEPSIQGCGGNAVMMRAAYHAKEMSRTEDEALAALCEWNQRCAQPPWSTAELARAVRNSEAALGAGLDRPIPDPPAPPAPGPAVPPPGASDLAWVESMQAYVARDRRTGTWNLANPLGEKGAVMALVARGISASDARAMLKDGEITLAARVDCDPTQPPTFYADGEAVLNNYIPPAVRPVPGGFQVIDEVVTFLTAGDVGARKWFVNWMAFAIQNPARPMRTVPVIYGAQRTGKSLLARALTTLIGEQNCATVRNEDIKSKFTSHFVTRLFVTVGEIEAGEVSHATSTLKYLTGEPFLVFEAKGASAFFVPNRIKMLCTSNQTLPVAVEGEADSRWVLLKQLEKPSPEYTAHMDSLFDQSNNEWSAKGRVELAALADFLLRYPVDVQLARAVYANAARATAVEASRSSVEQFVEAVRGSSLDAVWLAHVPDYERAGAAYDNMDIPSHEHLTGAAAVYATYRCFCRGSGLQPLGMGRFPGELERYAPDWRRLKAATSVQATRPWVYTGVPRDRQCRAQYLSVSMRQAALPLDRPAQASSSAAPEKTATVARLQQSLGFTPDNEEDDELPF